MRAAQLIRVPMSVFAVTAGCAAALALAACASDTPAPESGASAPTQEQMDWARAALERNPDLELLATDTDAGIFTVRDRHSGEIAVVRPGDLAAVPATQFAAAPVIRSMPAQPVPDHPEAPAAEAPAPPDGPDIADAGAAAPGAAPALDYTVERENGKLRVSGPGLSIVSTPPPTDETARGEAGQQVIDPFICEGPRMMQFDNRRVFVDGDAITARNGCELHITNSRIVASGTGVVVQDAAVHITNSHVEGAAAAYDAGAGARLFLHRTTLNGTLRRDAAAEIKELQAGQWH